MCCDISMTYLYFGMQYTLINTKRSISFSRILQILKENTISRFQINITWNYYSSDTYIAKKSWTAFSVLSWKSITRFDWRWNAEHVVAFNLFSFHTWHIFIHSLLFGFQILYCFTRHRSNQWIWMLLQPTNKQPTFTISIQKIHRFEVFMQNLLQQIFGFVIRQIFEKQTYIKKQWCCRICVNRIISYLKSNPLQFLYKRIDKCFSNAIKSTEISKIHWRKI